MLPKFLQSSQDAEKLSLTIRGASETVGALLVFMFTKQGLTEMDVSSTFDAVASVVLLLPVVVTSCRTIWGVIRKFIFKKKDFTDLGNKSNNDAS